MFEIHLSGSDIGGGILGRRGKWNVFFLLILGLHVSVADLKLGIDADEGVAWISR